MGKLTDGQKQSLIGLFEDAIDQLEGSDFNKIKATINSIQAKCILSRQSMMNAQLKREDRNKNHPVRVQSGQIYNVFISEDNIGKELNGQHNCVVISNSSKNTRAEKINVVPIEGDGSRIISNVSIAISNSDLKSGSMYKDPSRVIAADIMTIDKARIGELIGELDDSKFKEIMRLVNRQIDIRR